MAEDWLLEAGEAADWLGAENGTFPCDLQQQFPEDSDQRNAVSILWWTNAVCLPSIATLGLVCNGLNMLVLAGNEQARRMPSWHLLVALALFDSLFLLFAVLELAIPTSLEGALISIHTRYVLFLRMLASAFYKASILSVSPSSSPLHFPFPFQFRRIVVAFNVERYLCVCRPLWAHRTGILQRRARAGGRGRLGMIGMALGLGMLCSLQWPLAWRVIECQNEEGQGTPPPFSFVTMRNSPAFQFYYRLMDWFSLFAFNLCPIGLLSALNLQLVFTLRRIVRRDSSASSSLQLEGGQTGDSQHGQIGALEGSGSSAGLNANAMLFAVVLLLFVCIGPQAPARLFYEWYGHYHQDAILYTCISQQLVFLNASLNFCLYCLVSRRYRLLLKESLARLGIRIGGHEGGMSLGLGWMSVKFTPIGQNNVAGHAHGQSSNSSSAGEVDHQQQEQPFLRLWRDCECLD